MREYNPRVIPGNAVRRIVRSLAVLVVSLLTPAMARAADPAVIFADQGKNWNDATRADFYTWDQGSRMIPLAWLQALKQPNGQPFLADSLTRYGYLSNPQNSNRLPVGFSVSGPAGVEIVGMTCAACHTREIKAAGKAYRIDGGPAIVDFQSLLADLDVAVGQVLTSNAAFAPFAAAVLRTSTPDLSDVAMLRRDVDAWYLRYHTIVTRSLPTPGWGPARLDAVGMIFNRLTGLDLGPPPSLLIAENIQKADAPVRYPFLWNAPRQDKTQWPLFADNGNDILALARNLGEVIGVFGMFEPKREGWMINFLNKNSANFDGLHKLEDMVKKIGPPKWPWAIDANLAQQGKAIYEGACNECHKRDDGAVRFPLVQTWATRAENVQTDTREYDVVTRTAKTGMLQGAFIPFATRPLKETDQAINILATSVIGSIAEQALGGSSASPATAMVASAPGTQVPAAGTPPVTFTRLPEALRDLEGAFRSPVPQTEDAFEALGKAVPAPAVTAAALPPRGTYEARVLEGVWAAAPYLHNGSVPSLAELLKPAAERVKVFKVGSNYDTVNVGLAAEQTQFNYSYVTTDCSALNSGNSRCGHEYGTRLTAPEKKALLEYLKTL